MFPDLIGKDIDISLLSVAIVDTDRLRRLLSTDDERNDDIDSDSGSGSSSHKDAERSVSKKDSRISSARVTMRNLRGGREREREREGKGEEMTYVARLK